MDPLTGLNPLQSLQSGSPLGLANFGMLGNAASRCGGFGNPMGGQMEMLMQMQQLNMNLLGMLLTLMGAQGGSLPGLTGLGNTGASGPSGSTGASSPSGSTGSTSPVGSTSASSDSTPASTNPGSTNIGPGTKVLMIGDSHTVGAFGTELDKQLRTTGAQVATYGASGSSATQWANGGTTSSGYVERGANGQVVQPPWNQQHSIPKLEDLIAKEKPGVIIVNLGANFRGGDPTSQVRSLGEIAKKHGIKLIWVGPPKTREDSGNDSSIKAFDQKMAAAMAPYGTYIASDPFTPTYSGGDGLHYGTEAGKKWAQGIFGQLTGK